MSCSCHATITLDTTVHDTTIALVGNPNVGKSTLFNALTGARQRVINAPGTTVEMMRGNWKAVEANLLDLPGTYSLLAASPDEQVVVDTLAAVPGSFTDPENGGGLDLTVVVLDASALTRSLYLLGQVAQAGHNALAVLTMVDVADEAPDAEALSKVLGIDVVVIDPRHLGNADEFAALVKENIAHPKWVKGIEPSHTAPGARKHECKCGHCKAEAQASGLEQADAIFEWVEKLEAQAFGKLEQPLEPSFSDKVDRVLLHPLMGLPVFFFLMWLLFKIAGEWVSPIQDFFEQAFSDESKSYSLAHLIGLALKAVGWQDNWVHGLLIGGLCTGLGVVASFIPLMFIIFLMISILEDSGYMARAAFLGDRLMRAIGLDGRVIMPLIMGFGCNLPSLAATRTLPNAAQRLVTTLVIPYTSCAARLTIYLLITRIFFPTHTGTVVFSLYVLSLIMVVLGSLVLKPFITKGQSHAPLFLVLPAYQVPRVVVTLKNTWLRSWAFVVGAGKIILLMTLVVWLMGAIPMAGGHKFADSNLPMEDSLYGRTAQVLEPVFKPAGFGEWHMTGALMTGFVAKETVISSVVTSYNMDPEADGGDAEDGGDNLGQLPKLVRVSFAKSAGADAMVGAYAFLVFVLTYTPCLATVAEQARQIGARRAASAVGVQLVTAWILAVVVFQIGRLIW